MTIYGSHCKGKSPDSLTENAEGSHLHLFQELPTAAIHMWTQGNSSHLWHAVSAHQLYSSQSNLLSSVKNLDYTCKVGQGLKNGVDETPPVLADEWSPTGACDCMDIKIQFLWFYDKNLGPQDSWCHSALLWFIRLCCVTMDIEFCLPWQYPSSTWLQGGLAVFAADTWFPELALHHSGPLGAMRHCYVTMDTCFQQIPLRDSGLPGAMRPCCAIMGPCFY